MFALKRRHLLLIAALIAVAVLAVAPTAQARTVGRSPMLGPSARWWAIPGRVFVMTNETANSVAVFRRHADGSLIWQANVPTGGMGSGAGLGSQGALALSANGRWLFAVNAGSNQVSVFRVGPKGLKLTDIESSMGTMPVSVSVDAGRVYVLNDGGSGNIAGFWVSPFGKLMPIPGSVQPLSNGGIGSAPVAEQIGIKPLGNVVIVTEKSTNMIDVYTLAGGAAGPPTVFASNGAGPYGFGFTRQGTLIVSEAAANALSSYTVMPSSLTVISASVPDGHLAPCWVDVSPNSKFAYTSDAHSNDISIYSVGAGGTLTVSTAGAVTVATPLDLDTSHNGRFLYVLSAGSHMVAGYRVGCLGGSLTGIGSFGTLPPSATGLVAW